MSAADDELAVRNVLARVVYEGDGGTLEDYLELWDEHAVWAMPGVEHRGRDAIGHGMAQRRADGMSGTGSGKRHVLTTVEVRLHGDDADARSTWLLLGGDGLAAELLRFGLYTDRLRRTDGRWRMLERRITFGAAGAV